MSLAIRPSRFPVARRPTDCRLRRSWSAGAAGLTNCCPSPDRRKLFSGRTRAGRNSSPMFARFCHAWERRLAFATKDRVVRPFEWGTDWIHSARANGGPEDVVVERWVDQVMEDSTEFFALPPTSDFAFTNADAPARSKGEAGTLSFPSAFITPHPENNA